MNWRVELPKTNRRHAAASPKREISIGLLWHSAGAGNLGIGALTVGDLICARRAAQALGLTPRFTVLCFPNDMDARYIAGEDIEIFELSRRSILSPKGYWAELGKLDCIMDIGGGDSFTDIYSSKRFAFIWGTKEIAYLRRIPLLFSPQTIGPFTRQPFKALATHVMRKAYAIVARDPESMVAIKAMAPETRAVQAVDVAFELPFTVPPRADDGLLHVGVNVSGLLFRQNGENDHGLEIDYADLMLRFLTHLAAQPGVRTHLICHVLSERVPADDDGRIADRLAQEFPGAVRAPDFASPSDAKSYIAGMDFVVAGRMHACIAAYSAGVPVVPIAYSRKFSGLFVGVLNYPHQIPVKGMSTDEALAYLLRCLDDRAALRRSIIEGKTVVESALGAYDVVLRDFFKDSNAPRAQAAGLPGGLSASRPRTA